MKKTQLLMVLSTALMLSLTACSTPNGESTPSTDSTGESTSETVSTGEDKIQIEWKATYSYTEQIDQLIEWFEEENPDIEVTYNKLTGGYSDLKTNIITNIGAASLPNVVTCYPDHVAEYIDYGIVKNLQPYMDSTEDYGWTEEDYENTLLMETCQTFSRKGTYMLPHSSSTEAMFYNEGILGKTFNWEEGGVQHTPNDGQPITADYLNNITWEELLGELAPGILKYNAEHDNCFLDVSVTENEGVTTVAPSAVVSYSGADNAFVTFCELLGVEFSSYNKSEGHGEILFNNTNEMKDCLKTLNSYYKQDLFSTAGIEGQTNINVNDSKYAVFATGSTGGIKYQVSASNSFETGVMRIPNFEGKDHAVISQGPGTCVLKSGDEAKDLAAYKFSRYLCSEEASLYWALETGYFPVCSSCYGEEEYLNACDATGKSGLSLVKARAYTYANTIQDDLFTNFPFKGSDSARTLVGSLFNTIVGCKDELTDEYVNEKFQETVNSILNKMGS